MLSLRIFESWEALEVLADSWDPILRSCTRGIAGPDATCSLAWARALTQTHLKAEKARILVASSGQEPVAILPAYVRTSTRLPVPIRELRVLTEAYAGRCGFLIRDDDPALVEFLFDRLVENAIGWDVLVCTLAERSASFDRLQSSARRLSLHTQSVGTTESPYIALGASWDEVLAALPKKMRWTIRKGEKDLMSVGKLEYEEINSLAATQRLMQTLYEVELGSWKQESGTSITAQRQQSAFYEALVAAAARDGTLSAHVLRVDGKPIAYILGLVFGDGTFLDLKESFTTAHADYSPGHVLKRFAIEALIAKGVRLYDFMGNCEQYKMRWTDKTYRCHTLSVYNRTLGGRLRYGWSRLARTVRRSARTSDARQAERAS